MDDRTIYVSSAAVSRGMLNWASNSNTIDINDGAHQLHDRRSNHYRNSLRRIESLSWEILGHPQRATGTDVSAATYLFLSGSHVNPFPKGRLVFVYRSGTPTSLIWSPFETSPATENEETTELSSSESEEVSSPRRSVNTRVAEVSFRSCYLSQGMPDNWQNIVQLQLIGCRLTGKFNQETGERLPVQLDTSNLLNLRSLTVVACMALVHGDLRKTVYVGNLPTPFTRNTPDKRAPLEDIHFVKFPASLRRFTGSHLNITPKTLDKLPRGLEHLSLRRCPKLTFSKSRYQKMLPHCTVRLKDVKVTANPLERFQKQLNRKIIAQPIAVKVAASSLVDAMANKRPVKGRPIRVLLFFGSSGIGKTHLAKEMAKIAKIHYIEYNMTLFREESSVSKLTGACPGYKGYGETETLPQRIMANPRSLILFDEIEKAHSAVQKSLLGLLGEGWMRDSKGRKAYFDECIIIFTSNLGKDDLSELDITSMSEEEILKEASTIASNHFNTGNLSDFCSRINRCVPFFLPDPGSDEACAILKIKMDKLISTIKEAYGFIVTYDPRILRHYSEAVTSREGLRPPIANLENAVNTLIANGQGGTFREDDQIRLTLDGSALDFKFPGRSASDDDEEREEG